MSLAKPITPSLQHTVARHGELRLAFAHQHGKTYLRDSFSRPPLQVMRAIQDDAGCAVVYILTPTGGVVGGDRYDIRIQVEPGAHALVTTLAATKVYRMPDDHAVQRISIEVMDGAILEFVPDAAILFQDADLHQQIDVTLGGGALMIFQDSVVPGRRAFGESLNFRRFKNRITVRDTRGYLLYEQSDIQPHTDRLQRPTALADYQSWANWYLLGDLERVGLDPQTFCEGYTAPDGLLGAASRLHRDGVGVRLLGDYWDPVARALDTLRHTVRQHHMGLPTTNLRK